MSDRTPCVVCARSAPNAFLCGQCTSELRSWLQGLAGGSELPSGTKSLPWLEALEDVRLGRTRLGESARRSTENNTPLMVRLGPTPNSTRETQWVDSPVDVLKRFHGTMATWIRHLTESRGVKFIPVRSVPNDLVGPLREGWRRLPRDYRASSIDCAEWLAHHVAAIAQDEAAGELFNDVKRIVDDIERMVNRAVDPKYCGNCPAIIQDRDGTEHECATPLYVVWDHRVQRYPDKVQCWRCKSDYVADDLIQKALDDNPQEIGYTADEIKDLMAQIGRPISESTWSWWRRSKKLIDRSWFGADPMYWISDVKALMDAKAQKAPTGAAAKRYKQRVS